MRECNLRKKSIFAGVKESRFIFNPATLQFENDNESPHVHRLRVAGFVLAAILMVAFYIWLFFGVFKITLPKTAALRSVQAGWEAKVDIMQRELAEYESVLSGIEERDDDVYRAIYGLGGVLRSVETPDVRTGRFAYLGEEGVRGDIRRLAFKVEELEKRAYSQSKALDEVDAVSLETGDMVSAIPAVPPVLPDKSTFRLSSGFGYRIDPVYGGRAYHRGQDFAADKGTPVYATGDGVVEQVLFQFTGYGNEIIVNHGFGYKTLYAHLNTIEVQKGMKVQRGERIGTIGRTGKATGPHLHYEVIYKGERVNPRGYYDMDMPVSEYKAMIEKRAEESPRGKTSATSELLKKRGNVD